MHFLNPMLQNHPMESAFIQTWLNRLADKYSSNVFSNFSSGSASANTEMFIDVYDSRYEGAIYRDFLNSDSKVQALSICNGQLLNIGTFDVVYQDVKRRPNMLRVHSLQEGEVITPSCVTVHSYLVESALCRGYADVGLFGLCGSDKRVMHDYNLSYVFNTLDYLNSSLDKGDCLFCFGLDPYLLNWGKPLSALNVSALDELALSRPVCIVSNNFSMAFVNSALLEKIKQSAIGRSPAFSGFIESIKTLGYVDAEGMSILPWAFSDKELLGQLGTLPTTFDTIVNQGKKRGISHFEVALQSHFVELLFDNLIQSTSDKHRFSTYHTYQTHIDDLARVDHCEVMKISQLERLDEKVSVAIAIGRLATCGYKWVHDYHYEELFVPCNRILHNGSNLCLHSDFPREPLCPLRLAEIATERDIEAMPKNYSCDERTLDPGQCLTRLKALVAITHGAARHAKVASFNELGGAAHFMKLDHDPLIDNTRWRDIKAALL
ncbi:hypothetical protein J8M21_11385 [Pseudoalteromonas luteoviolacea]|uniref:hypothetical protein n=1 Tax=Pseudoalteromonas luteoviolacea TaxID=43657 RepID=UPI001B3A459C|nr:hypothetical protein [Pseudoalteromonas luteoviolacea]MBQ4877808.1 hypothetical protein [Pseudoalteromonas luteoviolacea]MBQ4906746.1 hypothetical protein [Pseudoalteromonas luteoviolacea]